MKVINLVTKIKENLWKLETPFIENGISGIGIWGICENIYLYNILSGNNVYLWTQYFGGSKKKTLRCYQYLIKISTETLFKIEWSAGFRKLS